MASSLFSAPSIRSNTGRRGFFCFAQSPSGDSSARRSGHGKVRDQSTRFPGATSPGHSSSRPIVRGCGQLTGRRTVFWRWTESPPSAVSIPLLTGKSLVRVDRLAHRVEATYTASRWGGLEVRASWSPTSRHDGIDLEIQVSASSVGELRGLETFVFSQITDPGASTGEPHGIWVSTARFPVGGLQ